TGEDGFEIIVENSAIVDVCERVLTLGENLGIGIVPCGLGARDTLRLEAGMPLYGHELSEEIDPFQAELAWAVKMEKGPFVGRESLDSRRQDGQLRRRVGLEIDGKRIGREGASVTSEAKEIGRLCSGTYSPTLEKTIAMAYV